MGQGRGTGPRGRGGSPPEEAPPGETEHKRERVRGERHKGKMIGNYLEKGTLPRGESRVELQEMLSTSQKYAEQALERERIPAELKEIPKKYFEKILPE